MKRWLFLIVLLIPSRLFAQNPCTTTVNADQTTVNATIAAAHDGDVICLNSTAGMPNGWADYTVTTPVFVGSGSIALELRGAGSIPTTCKEGDGVTNAQYIQGGCGSAGLTKIHINTSAGIGVFAVGNTTSLKNTIIDNIQFITDATSAIPSHGMISTGNSSPAPFIIHHNDFLFIGNTGNNCYGYGIVTYQNNGVIYRNRFIAQPIAACTYSNTNTNAIQSNFGGNVYQSWQTAGTYGNADTGGATNLYVEQNYFEDFTVAMDQSGASRVVNRVNELHNSNWVTHGPDSGIGPRETEYYLNYHYCDQQFDTSNTWAFRGGTGYIFDNNIPAQNLSECNFQRVAPSPVKYILYGASVCYDNWAGVPGIPPNDWPFEHQNGWGWTPSFITVGTSPAGATAKYNTNLPGLGGYPTDGAQQSLQPWWTFNNNNQSGQPFSQVSQAFPGNCRAMSYSANSKVTSTHLVVPDVVLTGEPVPYANVGQQIFASLSDLVGGTTPTVSFGTACASPTALTAGTNGSMRLSAWTCTATADGNFTVTFTHDNSSAARAGVVIVMRGLTATPVDQNPAVATINSTPYNSPSVTPGNSGNEFVLGYYAIAAPVTDSIGPSGFPGATLNVDYMPTSSCSSCGIQYTGINGTTGGSDITAVTSFRTVNSTSSIQTAATHVVGTVLTFTLTGTAGSSSFFQVPGDSYTGCGTSAILDVEPMSGTSYLTSQVQTFNTFGFCVNDTIKVLGTHLGGTSPANDLVLTVASVSTNVNGLSGVVTFKVNGSTAGNSIPLDLQSTDFIKYDREVFDDCGPNSGSNNCGGAFNGTTGAGAGTRASRPSTCTFNSSTGVGVAWWSTDQGSWNTSSYNSGQSGVLDVCTATNTWTNASYVPYTFPHPLDNINGTPCVTPTKLVITAQPSSATLGSTIGTVQVTEEDNSGNVCTSATDTITLSKDSGATWGTLSTASSLSKAASAGIATWASPDLSVTASAGSGSIDANASGLTGAVSNSITISASCTPAKLAVTAQPSNANVGGSLGQVSISVEDSMSNVCTSATNAVALAAHSGATWASLQSSSSLTHTPTAGVATWTDLFVSPTAGSGSIDATSSGLSTGTTNSITISAPCIPDHLTFTSQPNSALIGGSLGTISVAVQSAGGATCNDTRTITLSANVGTCLGMTLGGVLSGAASAGVFTTTNVNATVATGACALSASASGVTGATSNTFNISPLPPPPPSAGPSGKGGSRLHRLH